jgi:hypothetical protein
MGIRLARHGMALRLEPRPQDITTDQPAVERDSQPWRVSFLLGQQQGEAASELPARPRGLAGAAMHQPMLDTLRRGKERRRRPSNGEMTCQEAHAANRPRA